MEDQQGKCVAIVFDMDGLMIDSEPLWHIAEKRVFRTIGVELTTEDCESTCGLRLDEVVAHNFKKFNLKDGSGDSTAKEKEIFDSIVDTMEELLRAEAGTRAKPGLQQTLDFFAAKGLPMAVASSSPMRLIRAALDGLGIRDRFTVVCSAEDEEFGKPHPGVYITAAKKLGKVADRDRILCLEDSLNGTLAGKAARMKCISVPEVGKNACAAGFQIADAVLDSLEEINADFWDKLWS
eukprot:g1709.t1